MNRLRALAWAAFDFAETIFSVMIFTYAFPLWMDRMGGEHYHLTLARSLSVLLFLLIGPWWAHRVDQAGRDAPRNSFVWSVVGTALPVMMLSRAPSLPVLLVLFVLAGLAYQLALAFYNNLLPDVTQENTGFTSGMGVGLGYVGSAVALFLTRGFSLSFSTVFVLTGGLLLIMGLLTARAVQARTVQHTESLRFRELYGFLLQHRRFALFLLAAFSLTEPAHTGILLLSLYFKRVFSMDAGTIALLLGLSAVFATAGAFLWGMLADRLAPSRLMLWLFPLWSLGLLSAAVIPSWGVWVLAPGLGMLLAGIWVLLRLVVLELFHIGPLTLQFTFLALVERTASMIGPLLWSAIAHGFHDSAVGFRVATGTLALFPLLGLFVFFRIHPFQKA